MKWIERSQAAIDRLLQASQREQFFYPVVLDAGEDLLQSYPRLAEWLRIGVRVVYYQANRQLSEGDVEGCLDKAIALRRLGRLQRRNPWVISHLVGFAVQSYSFHLEQAVLEGGLLSDAQVDAYQVRLDSLPQTYDVSHAVDEYERFQALDLAAHSLKRRGPQALSWDINVICEQLNRDFDATVEIMKSPGTVLERQARIRSVLQWQPLSGSEMLLPYLFGTREQITRAWMDPLRVAAWPAAAELLAAESRDAAQLRVTRTALALTAFQRREQRFPDNLDEIANDLGEVATDPFDGQRLRYLVGDNSIIVYSIGLNGKDEEGSFDPEGHRNQPDDVAIRLPLR